MVFGPNYVVHLARKDNYLLCEATGGTACRPAKDQGLEVRYDNFIWTATVGASLTNNMSVPDS